ncbi:MAG: DegV family EDD domain-containing protein [Chloroflexi bacterium]|nr:DegV family EDD domain-containing protein [Chloroflexota bacterium]
MAAVRTRIVTDSSADLPAELVEEYGISVIPLKLQIGDEIIDDCPNLRCPGFHQRLAQSHAAPRIITPTVAEFISLYTQLSANNTEVVSIHLSSELSPAVNTANKAKASLMGRYNISVLDSQFVSAALGGLVIEAAKASCEGASALEITRLVRGLVAHSYFAFYVDSTEFLDCHHLVPPSYESMSIATGNRPVLLLEEGEIVPLQLQRNRGTQFERLVGFVAEFPSLKRIEVLTSGINPPPCEFADQLAGIFPREIIHQKVYGPVLGSLTGPTAICIFACEA